MKKRVDVLAVVQARSESTRLPGKIFERVCDKPVLEWVVTRLVEAKLVDRVVIATTTGDADNQVAALAEALKLGCVRGSVEDVLSRFIDALDLYPADIVVRATGDNPLLDTEALDAAIERHVSSRPDYTGSRDKVPTGLLAEVVSTGALRKAHEQARGEAYREHVTTFIHSNPGKFKIAEVSAPDYLRGRDYRLTVDTDEDLELMRVICGRLAREGRDFDAKNAVDLIDREPGLRRINNHVIQKNWRTQL